jgi:ATP-dependent Clp protease ATP-binding subunit ClpC
MPTFNFSDEFKQVLALSREEAARCNHEYIGTEHLLLGIIRDSEGKANRALQNLNVKLPVVQQTVLETVKMGNKPLRPNYELPYTSRSKKVLELSVDEAAILGQASVGPEHLLMGLIREKNGIAAQVLNHAGVTEDAARAEVHRLVS